MSAQETISRDSERRSRLVAGTTITASGTVIKLRSPLGTDVFGAICLRSVKIPRPLIDARTSRNASASNPAGIYDSRIRQNLVTGLASNGGSVLYERCAPRRSGATQRKPLSRKGDSSDREPLFYILEDARAALMLTLSPQLHHGAAHCLCAQTSNAVDRYVSGEIQHSPCGSLLGFTAFPKHECRMALEASNVGLQIKSDSRIYQRWGGLARYNCYVRGMGNIPRS